MGEFKVKDEESKTETKTETKKTPPKKKEPKQKDLLAIAFETDYKIFSAATHEWVMESTDVIANEDGMYDLDDLNKVLSRFMSNFAYLVSVVGAVNKRTKEIKDDWEIWHGQKYLDSLKLLGGKPTIQVIESHLYAQTKTEYEDKKSVVRDWEAKAQFVNDMMKVWINGSGILQSFNKNIVAELKQMDSNYGG